MDRKIRILVIPSDTVGGVGFYRSIQPHVYLQNHYPNDFEVVIEPEGMTKGLQFFDGFDIVHIHKGLYMNIDAVLDYCKSKGIATIMDIDDYWNVGSRHPAYFEQKRTKFNELIKKNFANFDYVTTTTPIFAKAIRKYNKNVLVLPNAIDTEAENFKIVKNKSERLRFGFIMGSTHKFDLEIIGNITRQLSKETLSKIQIVLCGYDLRGNMRMFNKETGEVVERPLEPTESVWYDYEKQLTDNYAIVSPEYKDFLLKFIPDSQYPLAAREPYARYWTKDINNYYKHYQNVDVLLAPLEETDFNLYKSQLKAIECCFSDTALIATNFGPYTIDLHSMVEKGGKINENGNALLVDSSKNHKLWAKYIEKCVKEPEIIGKLAKNLHNSLSGTYSLSAVSEKRANFYKKCLEEKANV